MKVIWQTTNQQPWVEVLLSGRTTVKTRTSFPIVPVGSVVLLHASKSKLWSRWRELSWAEEVDFDGLKSSLGHICGIGVVEAVGESYEMLTKREMKAFTFKDGRNCYAYYGVKFKKIQKLDNTVSTRGFQAPYARATEETINKILEANPRLAKEYEF